MCDYIKDENSWEKPLTTFNFIFLPENGIGNRKASQESISGIS
jgi:hypothetical protein